MHVYVADTNRSLRAFRFFAGVSFIRPHSRSKSLSSTVTSRKRSKTPRKLRHFVFSTLLSYGTLVSMQDRLQQESCKMMLPQRKMISSTTLVVLLLTMAAVTAANASTPRSAKEHKESRSQANGTGKLQQRGRVLQEFQFDSIAGTDPGGLTVTTLGKGKGKGGSQKSARPSQSPSVSPAPTFSVSPSAVPSYSQKPSASPSARPTRRPTKSPTDFPTTTPSFSPSEIPTTSPQPTPLRFETIGRVTDNGDVERLSTCPDPVPDNANPVATAVLNFQYNLRMEQNVEPDTAVAIIESRLHPAIARPFLDCQFDNADDSDFEVRALSSLPVDEAFQRCKAEDQESGSDCYVVKAGVTVEVFDFADARRRALQEWWFSDVTSSFGSVLTRLFGGRDLIEGGDDIVGLEFVGFTDGITGQLFDADTDEDIPDFSGANRGVQPSDDGNKNVILSSVLVGVAAVCLLVVGALAVRRRKRSKSREIGDMVALGDDLSEGDQSSYYGNSRRGGYPPEQPLDKVMVLSDMEVYDDNHTSSGFDIDPQWTPRSYDRNNVNPPTFVATEQRRVSMQKLRSPSASYASRSYVSADTVDL